MRAVEIPDDSLVDDILRGLETYHRPLPDPFRGAERVFEGIAESEFTGANRIKLLTDGQEFFDALFQENASAK